MNSEDLRTLYRRARALVLPAEEDFGIAPIEAMAGGRPVIAFGRGGALETVVPGVTGTLVPEQSVDAFASAMAACDPAKYEASAIRRHAESFSTARFEAGFTAAVNSLLAVPA